MAEYNLLLLTHPKRPMRKSLSRIKKFLGPSTSSQSSHVNHTHTLSLEQTKRSPNLPQILCENEDLKERISLLQKQKQLLQMQVNNSGKKDTDRSAEGSANVNRSSIRIQESAQCQNEEEPEVREVGQRHDSSVRKSQLRSFETQPLKQEQRQRRYSSSIKTYNRLNTGTPLSPRQSSQYPKDLQFELEQEQQKNRRLELKILRLNVKIENQNRERKQMLDIIEELRDKLRESTEYIMRMERIPNPEEQPLKSKESTEPQPPTWPVSPSFNPLHSQQYLSTLTGQLEAYRLRLQDYYLTKDQNYKLRDRIAGLILGNKILKEKVVYGTRAIQHLWKIKEVEMENIRLCVESMKVKD